MGEIVYDLYENPSYNTSKKRYHVRLTKPMEITYDEVKRRLCESSSVTGGDIDAVMDGLCDLLATDLSSGHRVCLGELGSFTPSIKAPSVDNPKEMNATKVKLAGVNYRPTERLMKRVKEKIHFSRAQANEHSLPVSEDEMYQRLLDFFEDNDCITMREFRLLMNFTYGTAVRRMRELCSSPKPFMKHMGPKNASVYVLCHNTYWEK